MAYEKDMDRHRLCDVDEHEEMQRIVESEIEINRGSHQDCSRKAGKIIKKEGNKEEVTSLAWRFWKEAPTSSRCMDAEVQEHTYAKKTQEEDIKPARNKKTIQVECEVANMHPKNLRSYDSFMLMIMF